MVFLLMSNGLSPLLLSTLIFLDGREWLLGLQVTGLPLVLFRNEGSVCCDSAK